MATSNAGFHEQVNMLLAELEAMKPVNHLWAAGVIRKLHEGVAKLQNDSAKLASAFILRNPTGGYVVRLPWRAKGYQRGREIEPGVWHFDHSDDVMQAAIEVGGEIRQQMRGE